MTQPDDHGQPEAHRPVPPRCSGGETFGRADGSRSDSQEQLPSRRSSQTPTGPGDGGGGVTPSETGGAHAGSRDPDAPGTRAVPTDDGDLEAVTRLMAFLRDPDVER